MNVRITVKATSGSQGSGGSAATPFILCDYGDPLSGFDLNPDFLVEKVDLPRAEKSQYIDRKNLSLDLKFEVTRKHKNGAKSMIYLLDHTTLLPRQGLVTIEIRDGNTIDQRVLEDAIIKPSGLRYRGATSFATYQIMGGEFAVTV
jgi:hypothetical protein